MASLNPLAQKVICPFCFAAFSGTEICFRCVNPRCSGRVEDSIYTTVRGIGPTVMGKILTPGKRMFGLALPEAVECDVCRVESRSRVCPSCHFELSHDVGKIDQYIISIIGGSYTGKTHYIVSLIVRLQREVGRNFNFSVRMIGDNTQIRWERDYYIPLFERKTVLPGTRPAGTDASVKAPLLFRLTLRNGNQIRALNLTFFDTAGEDMTNLDTMSIEARYIYRSNGIIFLLDPWQITEVRQHLSSMKLPPFDDLSKKPPLYDSRTAPEYMVGRLRDLFERMNLVKATQQIKIPVAFTLSKIDTLFPIVEAGSPLQRPSEHFGTLDLDDVQSVSTEIGNYLESWINPGFCSTIKDNFATYHYFGVSSLGGQPGSDDRLEAVNPVRVEDPFLWILHELKLIKGKKGR